MGSTIVAGDRSRAIAPAPTPERRHARRGLDDAETWILDTVFPRERATPLVTVLDGHPHTLAVLAGARGDRTRNLGVTEFGQSSDLADAHRIHGIDTGSIVDAALGLIGR